MFNHLLTECLFGSQNIAVSSGSSNDDLVKLKSILAAIPALSYICLDVANGYSEHFVTFVRTVRKEFPEHTIYGNTVSVFYFLSHDNLLITLRLGSILVNRRDGLKSLYLSGADIIKCAALLDAGSVCTTRKSNWSRQSPQLSACDRVC